MYYYITINLGMCIIISHIDLKYCIQPIIIIMIIIIVIVVLVFLQSNTQTLS
jgi:hypothetical protein